MAQSVPASPSSIAASWSARPARRRRRRRSPERACATLMLRPVSPRRRPRRVGAAAWRGGSWVCSWPLRRPRLLRVLPVLLRPSGPPLLRPRARPPAGAARELVVSFLYSSRLFFGLAALLLGLLLLTLCGFSSFARRLLRRLAALRLSLGIQAGRSLSRLAFFARARRSACSCCSRSRWARRSASARSSAKRRSSSRRSLGRAPFRRRTLCGDSLLFCSTRLTPRPSLVARPSASRFMRNFISAAARSCAFLFAALASTRARSLAASRCLAFGFAFAAAACSSARFAVAARSRSMRSARAFGLGRSFLGKRLLEQASFASPLLRGARAF